jgi:hypothetical protein
MATMSTADAERLRARLADHILKMDASELAIKAKSSKDLLDYLHGIIGGIAGALGYTIGAIAGIAWGIVESFAKGIEAGFTAGFRAGRGH